MLSLVFLTLVPAVLAAADEGVVWHEDYTAAYQLAKADKKDLFICFQQKAEFNRILRNSELQPSLSKYVCVRIPVSHEYKGKRVLDYGAFKEMLGKPGLAVVSLKDPKAHYYREVVSIHPFVTSRYSWVPAYGVDEVKTILNLPPGSLSQRSMIYAVKIHPERPRSINGRPHSSFLNHARQHSKRQAGMMNQHHADIISASSRLAAETGVAMAGASEVVAESWGRFVGGENVLEASFSCIDAWRHSPGHWGAVSRSQRFFGYDIAEGPNGTWYATGIFAQ